MELYWLSLLVIGFLASISAQSIYDAYDVHVFDDRRITPYIIGQQIDRLENENGETENMAGYFPVDYTGRSRAKQRAILDVEKYKELRRKEAEAKKLKLVVKKLSAMLPPLVKLLKKTEDEELLEI